MPSVAFSMPGSRRLIDGRGRSATSFQPRRISWPFFVLASTGPVLSPNFQTKSATNATTSTPATAKRRRTDMAKGYVDRSAVLSPGVHDELGHDHWIGGWKINLKDGAPPEGREAVVRLLGRIAQAERDASYVVGG